MKQKKYLAALLILVLAAGLLSGCSTAELGYFNLQKEMSGLKLYENSGEISIDLGQFPIEPQSQEEAKFLAQLKQTLQDYSLTYQGKVDMAGGLLDYSFYLKARNNGVQKEIASLVLKDDIIYIKVSEAVKLIKSFGDAKINKELDAVFGDAEYLSITSSEIIGAFDLSEDIPLGMQPLQQNLFTPAALGKNQSQIVILQKLFEGLMTEVYSGFETGLIEQSGNKYTFTLDAAGAAGLVKPLLLYTVENIEQLGIYLDNFVDSLSAEEMAVLGIEPYMLGEIKSLIFGVVAEVTAGREQFLQEIEVMDTELQEGFVQLLAGSKLAASVEKNGAGAYESVAQLDLKIGFPENAAAKLDLSIKGQSSLKTAAPFTLAVPTGGLITLTQLQAKLEKPVMTVQVEKKSFNLAKGGQKASGTMPVKMIGGSTYLPMRQVAESFGEQVGWNAKEAKAYVEKNGQKIYVTGKVIQGKTYIKIRDFEKLGYKIEWNGTTKTVTISK